MVVTGTLVSAVGYALAISDPDEFFSQQQYKIDDRRKGNRTGFGLLLAGSVLQMAGTLIAGFAAMV